MAGIVAQLHGELSLFIIFTKGLFICLVKHVRSFFFARLMANILNINVYEIKNVLLHVQQEHNVNIVDIQNVLQLE